MSENASSRFSRNSRSNPCSLRAGGKRRAWRRRMLPGTEASIKASRDSWPHARTISPISDASGPIWRFTNRSDQAKTFDAAAGSAEGAHGYRSSREPSPRRRAPGRCAGRSATDAVHGPSRGGSGSAPRRSYPTRWPLPANPVARRRRRVAHGAGTRAAGGYPSGPGGVRVAGVSGRRACLGCVAGRPARPLCRADGNGCARDLRG